MPTAAELRSAVLALVGALDPAAMTGEGAAHVVSDLAIIEKAAATGRMFAAVRVAQTDAWRGKGHRSAADWLAAEAGITVRDAAAQLGTAEKAEKLDKTKDQMRKGKLSPTQAGAVTDGATADPDAEDRLLDSAANDTTSKLKDEAARTKAAATDSATRDKRTRAERSVRTRTDADGAFCLHLRRPADDGVRLQALLRPYEEQAFRTGRSDGVRDTFENRSYDAFFDALAPLLAGADPSPDGTAAPATARPAGGNNVKVIVRIDHRALIRGHTVAGETCDVVGLGPISVATATELMADAFLADVVTKGRDVVNVAHLGRGLSAHQRTALEATGLRCSNRSCNATVGLQIDHRTPYAEHPETKLDNQDPLCPDCHRRKTHHGWRLEPGTGPRRFLPPPDPPDLAPGGTNPRVVDRTRASRGSPTHGERPSVRQPSLL